MSSMKKIVPVSVCNQMIKKLFLCLLFVFSAATLLGQTSVNKAPGEDYFIKLDYPATAAVGGFDVAQKAKGSATVESVVQVMAPAQRQTVGLKAPLLGGIYYYTVRAWVNVASGTASKKIYSADSNEVSMTVVVLPTPANAVIQ